MLRYDRRRFAAFGLLPCLNIVVLLIYGLGLSTHGTGSAAASLPTLIVVAALSLLSTLGAVIKRGRDIGFPAWATVVAFWVMLGTGLILGGIAYLAFAKAKPGADRFGPPASAAPGTLWFWALLNLGWPWVVVMAYQAFN